MKPCKHGQTFESPFWILHLHKLVNVLFASWTILLIISSTSTLKFANIYTHVYRSRLYLSLNSESCNESCADIGICQVLQDNFEHIFQILHVVINYSGVISELVEMIRFTRLRTQIDDHRWDFVVGVDTAESVELALIRHHFTAALFFIFLFSALWGGRTLEMGFPWSKNDQPPVEWISRSCHVETPVARQSDAERPLALQQLLHGRQWALCGHPVQLFLTDVAVKVTQAFRPFSEKCSLFAWWLTWRFQCIFYFPVEP